MYAFIKANQLDIMRILCTICLIMGFLLLITRFLPTRRKWILIGMELVAAFLLFFDRLAYIYSGGVGITSFIMVRLSNFMVFLLTPAVVFVFNLYLVDLLNNNKSKLTVIPKRLIFTGITSAIGMMLAVISQFTGLYYTFDSNNVYHRGPGFILCYLIPVICPIIQFTVIFENRKKFSIYIYTAMTLYIFVPIVMGIIQIFTYGISIVNMAMVLVSISLYIFTYLDVNDEVIKAHNLEMENLKNEKKSTKRLFEQTAEAFVKAVEKKDDEKQGYSVMVAEMARRIAEAAGKSEEECDEVYYASLLHNIGMIGMPDAIVEKTDDLTKMEYERIKQKPILSSEILSGITEYPYLSIAARYCCERYDGTGYPEGLKGEAIPEISRIIAIADAYVAMSIKQKYRDALPLPIIREEFVKGGGTQFDPTYADIAIQLIDADVNESIITEEVPIETELKCGEYRDKISAGIIIDDTITRVKFSCVRLGNELGGFSQPSIILFDSYDRHAYSSQRAIDAFSYIEYGELWFDGHNVLTGARNIRIRTLGNDNDQGNDEAGQAYAITAGRYGDHLKLLMESGGRIIEAIVALPDKTRAAYIGITGENCYITGIDVEKTDEAVRAEDIPRIEDELDYTYRLSSDVPNIQIDRTRSDATEGIAISDHLKLNFHSMSLPSASLVWHCPYLVLFYSDDKKVFGEGYREYALIKLNGESDPVKEFAQNKFIIKKTEKFQNWNVWKTTCQRGMEFEVLLKKKGNTVTTIAENLGIYIENVTTINDGNNKIYAALTGDQVALTDIRIR
ncbi:HD-GYP domain-containing protein [Butyrivibrio sp. JL13D10]|uniref:HD-GYP domain-containing protein n=1 Tax=Butyrivibrio sp. JL13D10 TaxID=3236815 RepID=UPI0038B5FA53